MATVPIPQRKPAINQDTGFLDTITSLVTGAATAGLDLISKQYEFEQQKEMMELQLQMEQQANLANVTGAPTGGGSVPVSGISLAGFSPVTIAVLAVAGVILLR